MGNECEHIVQCQRFVKDISSQHGMMTDFQYVLSFSTKIRFSFGSTNCKTNLFLISTAVLTGTTKARSQRPNSPTVRPPNQRRLPIVTCLVVASLSLSLLRIITTTT